MNKKTKGKANISKKKTQKIEMRRRKVENIKHK